MSRLESPFESAVDSNRSRYAFSVLFHLRQLTDLGRHRCQLRLGHQDSISEWRSNGCTGLFALWASISSMNLKIFIESTCAYLIPSLFLLLR